MTVHINGVYSVKIENKFYSPEIQTLPQNEALWQRTLKEARERGLPAFCQCNHAVINNALSIRYHQQRTEYYSLAKYPKQGANHVPKCRFHAALPQLSGKQGYEAKAKVVEETVDGYKIKLERGAEVREIGLPNAGGDRDNSRPRTPTPQKTAMTMLGLMHFLFDIARLNVWYPGMRDKRTWGVVAREIFKQMDKVKCGRLRLDEQLLIGIWAGTSKDKAPAEDVGLAMRQQIEAHNLALCKKAGSKRRLVVFGRLANYRETEFPTNFPIREYDGLPYIEWTQDQRNDAQRRFPISFAAWMASREVCFIAHIEPDPDRKSKWRIANFAFQGISSGFFPVDSKHEYDVAKRLIEEGRTFEKPLRYDAGEDAVFPDFILLDTDRDKYPMEVFGRTDQEYEDRAEEKRKYYNENFKSNWWCWKAAYGEPMPDFPPMKAK